MSSRSFTTERFWKPAQEKNKEVKQFLCDSAISGLESGEIGACGNAISQSTGDAPAMPPKHPPPHIPMYQKELSRRTRKMATLGVPGPSSSLTSGHALPHLSPPLHTDLTSR